MSADQTPYGPTWYAATMVAAADRLPLTQDLDVDVCVIGGGITGLTVAREVARRGRSVVVLEAARVAWSASGRNAGVVAPGFAEPIEAVVERVGLARARELWALSVAGVEHVRAMARDGAMAGVDPVDGYLLVRRIDDEDRLLGDVAMMRVDLGAEVEAWPTEQVREVLLSPSYFQAMHFPTAFHIHPLNYALGLAAAAERAGVRIFEQTAALAVDPEGVRKRVDTANGRVRAGDVVLAAGAHLGRLFPPVAETIVAVSGYVATTAPLGERLFEAIRYSGAVADARRMGDGYRVVGGDRLMWGGRITTRMSTPRRLAKLIQRDIRRTFRQLGDVEITHAWSGTTSYAVHKMPQIGEIARGVWLLGAFGRHGLANSAVAAELIAAAIVDGDDRWRLFSDYELVWAGGRAGRAAARIICWSLPVGDVLDEQLARGRAALRRRAAEWAARRAENKAARKTARLAAEEEGRRLAEARRVAAEEAARQAAAEARRREAEATRQLIDEVAGLEAKDVAQRLADALREADQDAARRAADAAAMGVPQPDGSIAASAHNPAESIPDVGATIGEFDGSALREPISTGPDLDHAADVLAAPSIDAAADEPSDRSRRRRARTKR